jgi:hypothetical protein
MTGNRAWLKTLNPVPLKSWPVKLADNSIIWAAVVGTIDIVANAAGNIITHTLTNVLLIPGLKRNLFSIGTSDKKGYTFTCSCETCNIGNKSGQSLITGIFEGQLYCLNFRAVPHGSTSKLTELRNETAEKDDIFNGLA